VHHTKSGGPNAELIRRESQTTRRGAHRIKIFPVKLESTERLPFTALLQFYLFSENYVPSHIQTVATAGRISDTSTHCVG
jgi:hypothetical protein